MPKETVEKIPMLRPKQLKSLLKLAILNKKKILIVGKPGVGKTGIARQVASEIDYDVITDHPVYGDPTDAKGVIWYDQATHQADYHPVGNLAKVLAAKKPTLWLIDDFGQASQSVQASYMPPLLDRAINGHPIPDCVSVIATTNGRTHKAGVQGLLEPVKSRFDSIVGLTVNLEDSRNYFFKIAEGDEHLEDAAVELAGFLSMRESLLHDFQPTADLTNSPCPRTWEALMRWVALFLKEPGDPNVELAMMSGAVGAGAAAEYVGYQRVRRSITPPDAILLNPDKAHIPCENPSAMFATVVGLANLANRNNFDRIHTYAERLRLHKCSEHRNGKVEMAVLLLRDSWMQHQEVQETRSFSQIMAGPLGDMIRGND